MLYWFQLFGLRRQMTGNLGVEPAVDLCGQMNDFDRHGEVLFKSPGLRANEPG